MRPAEEGITFPEPLTCQALCLELYPHSLSTSPAVPGDGRSHALHLTEGETEAQRGTRAQH